jgi:propionyl-CoA synthetase
MTVSLACRRVIIHLPMIPEAVVAMLARTRIAVRSVVSGSFAARTGAAHRRRQGRDVGFLRGSEVSRVVGYRPILDRAIGLSSHNHGAASSCSARGHLVGAGNRVSRV